MCNMTLTSAAATSATTSSSTTSATTTNTSSTRHGFPDSAKLVIGAGGIYASYLYHGSLQEDVFRYTSPTDGSSFQQAWFLQVIESFASLIVALIGMYIVSGGPTPGITLKYFGLSGAAQVSSKACTSLALTKGLSFPVAILAKSAKMAPVMAGSLLLGGASYSFREYIQVAIIILGTAIVSLGKKKGGAAAHHNSTLGVCYIVLSLVLDGVTAGFQKRILRDATAKSSSTLPLPHSSIHHLHHQQNQHQQYQKPKSYDFMFWTNIFMCLVALAVAFCFDELRTGLLFCLEQPDLLHKIIRFAICSAIGQTFIFYTIANFDPLVLSTITTTRKIASVLLSIFFKGHSLSPLGWCGVLLTCGCLLAELGYRTGRKAMGRKI